MRLFPWLVMFCAAFSAGVINSIAGGGTLITFPVLIWLGLDPKVANGTSTVALWPGLFGGLFGYRKQLQDSSTILFRLGITSVIGGAVGAWLLIWTPSPVFADLVPFLILFATILFSFVPVAQLAWPRLRIATALQAGRSMAGTREGNRARHVLVVAQVAIALVLLIGSGLMIRTALSMRNVDPGFADPDGVLTFQLSQPEETVQQTDDAAVRAAERTRASGQTPCYHRAADG